MRTYRRRVAAVLVLAVVSVGVALLLGRGSNADAGAAEVRKAGALSHALLREREQGGVSGAEGADAQSYADRAFPETEVSFEKIQGAINSNGKLAKKAAKLGSKWDGLGPVTLDVDRLGTQSFIK